MSDVGMNLQLVRGERSQTWLADRMREKGWRWSQPTVSAIEKGERALQLPEAVDLVDVLGLTSLDELVEFPLRMVARSALDRARDADTAAEEARLRQRATRAELCRLLQRMDETGVEPPGGRGVWLDLISYDGALVP